MSAATGQGYVHSALLYDTPAQLLAAAVPFLAEGLTAGETAVLACSAEHNRLLAEALGGDERTVVMDRGDIYTRSAVAVATYRGMVQRQVAATGRRVRLVGEVRYGDQPESWAEWTRFESVCNVALGPLPLSSVCAYDTRFLPEQLRRGIAQTHPALLTAHGRTPNDLYEDPATVLRRTSPHGADPVEVTAPTLHPAALTEVTQLADLRTQLRGVLDPLRQHLQLCEDFFTAVVEVATNGLRHGRPPLDVRLWITRDRLVCTVTDRGVGFDDPLAGYRPYGAEPLHGMGLWLVRQACDRIDAYRTPGRFTVRLVTGLPRGPGDPGNAAGTAP